MSLFLLSLLTSCGIAIPSEFVRDCHKTYLVADPATNADVYQLAIDRGFDIDSCNADRAALREYLKSHPKLRIKEE